MRQDARPAPRWQKLALLTAFVINGCATLGGDPGQPLVPSRYETRTGPFAIYTNTAITGDAQAVRSLRSLERDLTSRLGLRVPADGPPIEVYILRDRDAFTHFLTFYYPELPPRRAFFLAQGPRRVIYTFQNERLDEDLRHEATHALLHITVGDLPLWLDEGLAEYFEGPDDRQGVNPEHLTRLPDDLKAGWRPDLARLETLKSVREMTPRDYREAWAWVHALLNGPVTGKSALLGQLADLASRPKTVEPLSDRLARLDKAPTADTQRLLSHLDQLRSSPPPGPVASAPGPVDPTVLFQNSDLSPPRRSAFSRVLSFFGLGGKKEEGR
jgi:hypothetical protein